MQDTELLVIGAGPYAYSAAAHAKARGIATRVVGRPMGFWRDQMPADMFLRSGRDWSLDADDEHSFVAFFEERGFSADEHDPIPISVFLDHAEWFRQQKGLEVEEMLVESLARREDGFEARMSDGGTVTARRVLAAPGIAHFVQLPEWYDDVPADRRAHTSERVAFVGGRQSAYEWAALLCDHGASRVDVVHRHDTPAFEKVSWAFVDPYVEQTLQHRGWWRGLPEERRRAIALEFWQVGRAGTAPGAGRRAVAPADAGHGRRCHRPGRRTSGALGRGPVGGRPGHRRVGVPGRPRGRAVPRRRARRCLRDRRLPRPLSGLRDDAAGALCDRLRGNARLRALLRVHQGVSVGRTDLGRRDAGLTVISRPGPLADA